MTAIMTIVLCHFIVAMVLCNVQDSTFSDKVFEVEPATKFICVPCTNKMRVYKVNAQRGELEMRCMKSAGMEAGSGFEWVWISRKVQ